MGWLIIYLAIGMGLLFIERRTGETEFNFKDTDLTPLASKLIGIQLICHYFRYIISWPFYLIEDFVLAALVDQTGVDTFVEAVSKDGLSQEGENEDSNF